MIVIDVILQDSWMKCLCRTVLNTFEALLC